MVPQTVVVSWNEDVEIGRCVSKMLNLQCTWAWEVRERERERGGGCPIFLPRKPSLIIGSFV